MQFKVPQNVQREDTIIGPITFKQLIILFGGGGLTYVIYSLLATKYFWEIWLWPVIIGTSLTLAFAFLKINERDFHVYLVNLLEHILIPKKRLWKQGSGETFVSPFSKLYVKKVKEKEPEKTTTPDMGKILKKLNSSGTLNKNA